ncbi:MAG: atsA 4 [Planctomycetaceae bacterium]|nr:atsA 4 [Planctomycetaceae bacterium]
MMCKQQKYSLIWLSLFSLFLLSGEETQAAESQAVAANGASAKSAKNIVVIIGDDLGRTLGCYGDKNARTPHIDAFAKSGTRFDNAFCTTASCSPSRSVILSGLYNHANGQYGLAHAEHHFQSHAWVKGLPVLLKESGYRTCLIGKFHVLPEANYQFEKTADLKTQGARNSVRMAENAEEFIKENDPRPFFLYYSSTDPHRAKEGYANETAYPGVKPATIDPKEIEVPPFLPNEPEVRQDLAEYYMSVARLDQGVGRLLQALKNTQHEADTLVVFLSDNGIPFPGAKTGHYEPGVRLPLICRIPGQKPGLVSASFVTWADITPTLLEYAGAAGPDKYKLHGQSFLPGIADAGWSGRDHVFLSHTFHEVTMYYPMRTIRTGKHKLIVNLAGNLPFPFASDLYFSPTWQGALKRQDSQYGNRMLSAFLQRP